MKVIQVTIENDVHAALKNAAKESRLAMAEVIRQVLAQWSARRTKKGSAS